MRTRNLETGRYELFRFDSGPSYNYAEKTIYAFLELRLNTKNRFVLFKWRSKIYHVFFTRQYENMSMTRRERCCNMHLWK